MITNVLTKWYHSSEHGNKNQLPWMSTEITPVTICILWLCCFCAQENLPDDDDDFEEFRVRSSELVRDTVFIVGASEVFFQASLLNASLSGSFYCLAFLISVLGSLYNLSMWELYAKSRTGRNGISEGLSLRLSGRWVKGNLRWGCWQQGLAVVSQLVRKHQLGVKVKHILIAYFVSNISARNLKISFSVSNLQRHCVVVQTM